jgi:uncharacterized membrane protein YecN with MAPEG domain
MPRITLLFTALHILLMLLLAYRVVGHRRVAKVGIGTGGDYRLERKVRAHANFIEYVPMALLMLALLEIAGLAAVWLWALGGTLLVARLLHATGLSKKSGYSVGRFHGTLLTWLVLAAMAGAGLWLFAVPG